MSLLLSAGLLQAADAPSTEISNRDLRVKVYLPDAKNGFYRGTRFDWSGVIYSLRYKGHEYYGPWFHRTNPTIRDFIYEGNEIVAGPCSSVTGPADEFRPLGWDAAKPGATFIKIGVGALRKPADLGADARYDAYRLYEIADGGKWTVSTKRGSVEFTQQLKDASSGYGYTYKKVIRLTPGKPEFVLEHTLQNTGTLAINTTMYNHNFLIMDGQAPGPGLTMTMPFDIQSRRPPNKELAEIRGKQLAYVKALEGKDVVAFPVEGFDASPAQNHVRVENSKLGIGMSIAADRPLHSANLWSIRSVMAIEPFVAVAIEPGASFSWKSTYNYYTLP